MDRDFDARIEGIEAGFGRDSSRIPDKYFQELSIFRHLYLGFSLAEMGWQLK
jgi:hypothetical protein